MKLQVKNTFICVEDQGSSLQSSSKDRCRSRWADITDEEDCLATIETPKTLLNDMHDDNSNAGWSPTTVSSGEDANPSTLAGITDDDSSGSNHGEEEQQATLRMPGKSEQVPDKKLSQVCSNANEPRSSSMEDDGSFKDYTGQDGKCVPVLGPDEDEHTVNGKESPTAQTTKMQTSSLLCHECSRPECKHGTRCNRGSKCKFCHCLVHAMHPAKRHMKAKGRHASRGDPCDPVAEDTAAWLTDDGF